MGDCRRGTEADPAQPEWLGCSLQVRIVANRIPKKLHIRATWPSLMPLPAWVIPAERLMPRKRFLMNAGRTTKQGQQINVGKDSPEYQAIVGTITMHPDDMKD